MADVRDATWRFINLAPIMGGQAALDDLFSETLYPFGVNRFDCVRLLAGGEAEPPGVMSGRGLTAWNQYFAEQGYPAVDPCIIAYPRLSGAFTWSDVKTLAPEHADSPIWSDARSYGMHEGLIVPTAPKRTTAAIVRLITPETGFDPDVVPLLQSISVIYASSTQSFHASAHAGPRLPPPPSPLTDREIECLYWAARGKTNMEIGVILKISRHTVNTHIESVKTKLGVATRVQAAGIAHSLGLLSIT
jgi:LuxR family transcriptional regulator, quorum-sensing system regulator BjaR1